METQSIDEQVKTSVGEYLKTKEFRHQLNSQILKLIECKVRPFSEGPHQVSWEEQNSPVSERQRKILMNCGFRYCQREDGEEGMETIWEDKDVVIAWNRFDETRRDWLSLYVDEKRISCHNDLASLLCSMIRSFLYGLGKMIADKFVSGC